MEVWLVFSSKTLVDPELNSLSQTVYNEMHQAVTMVLQRLIDLQITKQNLDIELEIERLYALIDGMSMHCILHPDQLSPEKKCKRH